MKKDEKGRSMVEVLGVLALMAILSVVAVAGFRVMVNKNKANTVISEAKLAFIEAHAKQNVDLNKWEEVSFTPSYNYPIQTMRDFKSNDYVKVSKVAEEVCARMLPMQVEGQLAFYTEAYEELTECADENTMIVAWNGVGVPAECEKTSDCDVGEYSLENTDGNGFPGFCNASGHCQKCDENIEKVNENRDGCDCKATAQSCSDDEGNTWCCSEELVCDKANKDCKDGGGLCYYDVAQQTQSLSSNCSYKVGQQSQNLATNCAYTVSENGITPIAGEGCNEDEYCYLAYKDNKCATTAGGDYTGKVYGTCLRRTAFTSQCNITVDAGTPVLSDYQGNCGNDEYCYLAYKDNKCATTAGGDYTDRIYGTCLKRTAFTSQCNISVDTGTQVLTEEQGCPVNQYCYLKWLTWQQPNTCTGDAGGDKTGRIYGSCLPRDNFTPACPNTTVAN